MQAGKLDTRVTFFEKVKVSDGGGGSTVQWVEVGGQGQGGRWAALWPTTQNKADEEVSASRVANTPDYRLIVRSDSMTRQVKAEWRIKVANRTFAIKSVGLPDRQRGTITMIVQEGQPT